MIDAFVERLDMKQLGFERVIAEALASQMHKIKGRIETVDRGHKHSAALSGHRPAAFGRALAQHFG